MNYEKLFTEILYADTHKKRYDAITSVRIALRETYAEGLADGKETYDRLLEAI
jgi:hypothetical protein